MKRSTYLPIAILAALCASLPAAQTANAMTHIVTWDPVEFDRWIYPFNGTPGFRNLASTFNAIGSAPAFDNKDAIFFVAVDTASAGIPAGEGPSNYNAITIRVTATHFAGAFDYDPTYDPWQSYLDPTDPEWAVDSDAGRPIELYGVGFRNGYESPLAVGASFQSGPPGYEENETFCAGCPSGQGQGVRNIFPYDPSVPDPEGDASNNVARFPPLVGSSFDTVPFAIGQSTSGLSPGDPVPQGVNGVRAGETFEFIVDMANPDILAYVQESLDEGVLAFAISSMHETVQFVGGTNPNFYTSESIDSAAIAPTIEVTVTVPEPAQALGLGAGACLLLELTRRRRKSSH